jgi:signal transduction histidine kinase
VEERVLVLALRGRDAVVISQLLGRQGHTCCLCASGDDLAQRLAEGAGTALVTEESLAETDRRALAHWLASQPAWSDFPFILLATKRAGRRNREAAQVLAQLGNVIVLERPIHGETLASAAASALRGRRRQYEARRHLEDLGAAEEGLRQLNATLETRISERTHELSRANNLLMQEVAERERAQAALVQSQKMEAVGQLTGGIAHDFNNLLTVIAGNLELIQRRSDDRRTGGLVESALQASDRASKLTRQLLAFSRTQRLTLKPVDVNALIEGMKDLLARTIGPDHPIEMSLAKAGAWAMADANQLELAILNLVINARDAMSGGGAVRIESASLASSGPSPPPGDYAVIRVRDTGPGIPSNLIEKVFEPFFTTKPLGKGTGLGLAQVYGIAQQSGGGARVESHEGEGATVEIWLPTAVSCASEGESTPLPVVFRKGRRERVLVVEDDAAVRRFIVECLEMLGYSVIEASHGREGLEQLDRETPALMIVDYAMPHMNGAEVAAKARVKSPKLPIILATGYADMDAVHRVIDARNVLKKPFQVGDLERAVRAALAAA